jgi:D-3-phosphoglycerate dehydrogenase
MSKVLITTLPFGEIDRYPLDILEQNNISYIINPLGKKPNESELIKLLGDCEVIIAGTEKISEKTMLAAKNLKLISRVGVGLDGVDLVAAKKNDILVSYTPDAPAPAVVDLTMGLMYSMLRNLHTANAQMHQGYWKKSFGRRLTDCCIGIIGAGRMGSEVIQNLKALGCKKILYYDVNIRLDIEDNNQIKFSTHDEIYKQCDVISFHVPLNLKTNNMITLKEMNKMKSNVLIINTARGGIVNEQDLEVALRDKIIAGAAIDVFKTEPYEGSLSNYKNCLLTPHMGSSTIDCRRRMEAEATEEAIRFILNSEQRQPVPESEYMLRQEEAHNEKK